LKAQELRSVKIFEGSCFLHHLRVFLLTPPSISSTPPTFFKISKKSSDYLRKHTDITLPKLLPEVKIYHRKSTSGSQNVSPEVDFHKSKYITGSRLLKVKIYQRKSTFGSQNISSKVDFQKSKYITGSQLSEVKIYHRKLTSENKKSLPKVVFRKSKN